MWDKMNKTTVDAAGGFLDESYTVQTPSTENKKTDNNCIFPITIHQLYKDTPDSYKIAGLPAKTLCLYAIVRKIDTVATKVSYSLEDETGKATAIRWLDSEDANDNIQVGCYVKVIGSLRDQTDLGRFLFVLRIMPVSKICEVYSHILEISYMSLLQESNSKQVVSPTNQTINNDDVQGLDPDHSLVLKIIQDNSITDNGIEKSELISKLPTRFASKKTDEILEFLTSEGHIYTTCTDDYFKAT